MSEDYLDLPLKIRVKLPLELRVESSAGEVRTLPCARTEWEPSEGDETGLVGGHLRVDTGPLWRFEGTICFCKWELLGADGSLIAQGTNHEQVVRCGDALNVGIEVTDGGFSSW